MPDDASGVAPATFPKIRDAEDFATAFSVPRETVRQLKIYETLLLQWQKATNLVAPGTLPDIWERHFADSAQLALIAPSARNWLDLGSGAGFPGLVIAIMMANRQNCSVHLVESNSRKCAFLQEVARQTGLSVMIHEGRIEDVSRKEQVRDIDVVTARALAPLDRLLALADAFFAERTIGLFLKGREAAREVEEARGHPHFSLSSIPSRIHGEGRIIEARRL